jgi:hypothetical protein
VAAFPITAITPILALALASAAFTDVLVRGLDQWRTRARRGFSALSDERTESIARSVQQDRVTSLNREIVPFLISLVDGAPVTEEARERAREISRRARSLIVAQADRTWLETHAEQTSRADPTTRGVSKVTVHDEARLALHMTTDERTAVRAFLSAATSLVSFVPDKSSIGILDEDGRCAVVMRVAVASPDHAMHGELAPYLAVLRVVFGDLEADSGSAELTLRFSYEQR